MPAIYEVTFESEEPVLLTANEFADKLLDRGFSIREAVLRKNELIRYGAVQLGSVYRAVWQEDRDERGKEAADGQS